MAKKYDTNPLDADFPKKVRMNSETSKQTDAPTEFLEELETQNFSSAKETDYQTRPFAEPQSDKQIYSTFGNQGFQNFETRNFGNAANQDEFYQSVYAPPPSPVMPLKASQSETLENISRPSSRKVAGIGLPENVLIVLPYLPISPVAIVMAIITLLTVARTETKVRFHAAQGLALHFAWIGIVIILRVVDNVSNWGDTAAFFLNLTMFICFIIWSVKAWKGKPIHIEAVDGLTDWLEEKISVKK